MPAAGLGAAAAGSLCLASLDPEPQIHNYPARRAAATAALHIPQVFSIAGNSLKKI